MRQASVVRTLLCVVFALATSTQALAADTGSPGAPVSASGAQEGLYEIRNYHYDPAQLDAYRQWAVHDAIPFFRAHMDVVGFWIGNDHPPKIGGSKPMDLELGSANITWIIRWDSMAARTRFNKEVYGGEQWRAVWAKHPDPEGYFQSEARFTTAY